MNGGATAGATTAPPVRPDGTKAPRTVLATVVIVSILLHVAGGVGAAIYIVVKWIQPPEATFVAKKFVTLPPKFTDPRMAAAEFEAAAPKPVLDEKIASLRMTDISLPDLPMMPATQLMEFTPSEFVSAEVTGLVGGAGAGGGGGGGGGGDGTGLGINFFGIQAEGRSVLILFDISQSVLTKATRAGVSIGKIKEETRKLIDSISINTSFGLIQFARVFMPFKQEMVAPTQDNKEQARQWLDKKFSTTGTLGGSGVISPRPNGIEVVLEYAFKMSPDVIFIISDGDFQRTTNEVEHEQVDLGRLNDEVEKWQATRVKPAVIHFIGFEVKPEHEPDLKRLARKNGGTMKVVK